MVSRSARGWLFLAGAVVVLLAAYTIVGFLVVPRVARSQLLTFVSENYGRTATIGQIRFNPYTFTLEAHDFSLPDADGQRLLGFERLLVDVDVATAWRLAASFSAIEIDRPFARVLIRPDATLTLADLAKPFQEPPSPSTAPEKAEPTRLFIDRFRVSAADVAFEDQTRPAPFRVRLHPITFELRDFSTTGKTGNAYSLRGASAAGERFGWEGSFALAPLASRGRFELANVWARTLGAYLGDTLGFEISGGLIDLNGDYDFAAAQAVQLKVDVHQVAVADFGIRPRGTDADYVHLASLQVDNTKLDLARERVEIGKIQVAGGAIRAWRDAQGGINLLELAKPGAANASTGIAAERSGVAPANTSPTPAEPIATSEKSSWVLDAPDIAIQGLSVSLEDRFVQPAAAFALTPIDVNVAGFTTAPGAKLRIDAKVGIAKSGELTAHAEAAPESGAVSAHVGLKGFDLASLQPYINTYTQITLLRGALDTELDIERAADGALTVKGDTEVTKLRTVDNALKQDLLKWDRLRVSGIAYASQPASLRIANVSAVAPYARVIIAPDQTLNITRVMRPAAGATPAAVQTVQTADGATRAPGGNPGAMPIRIGTVRIANGSANFADFWIQPNYAVSLQGMNGAIVGLSSDPKSRAKVNLEGKVDRYAPANIAGEINLLSAALFTDMKVSFKGVEMTSVTPYSGRFAGYKIEKGKLSIDVAYHVDNRQLKADQRFVVDQLQLGERVDSPDAVRLPLRLAVALLKDRNGVIDINLPMTGSLDDPKFRLGPLIWKAFVGLLGKVATAPFALLGSLFGGGEAMNLIDFEPGQATLDATGEERIASLIKALKERPQLQLEVPMSYLRELDGPQIAARKLDERLTALAQQKPAGKKRGSPEADQTVSADPEQRFELLLAQYRLDFGAENPLPPATDAVITARKKKSSDVSFEAANSELTTASIEKQAATEQELEQLAEARAHAIQEALLRSGEIDPSRVFILGASQTKPAGNKVQLALSLK